MSMNMKKRCGLRTASLVAAAVAGPAAILMPAISFAAPTVTITNLGTPSDTNVAHSGAGWTAFLVTVNADPGDVVGEIDMGDPGQGNTSLTNGLFGSFLQNWVPPAGKNPATPTPILPDKSGQSYGLDSHILYPLANMVALPAPYEDSSKVLTSGSTPTNPTSDGSDLFGTGTSIHGIFGLTNQTPSVQLAYLVLPTAGTAKAGSYSLTISEAPAAGGLATIFNGITGSIGGSPITTVTTHNIINLTSATQAAGSYGVQLTSGTGANQATFVPNAPVAGNINVTKVGTGSYIPGFANAVSGATAGTGAIADFAAISGFAAGDQEIYALKLLVGSSTPTTTQMNSIVADIAGQSGDGVSTVASLIGSPTGLAGQIAGLFPGYDLMLTVSSGSATPFLGFDFSQETNVGGVVVTNIAAVPEPASAAILLIGSSLLLGRRKRNALMA
jgi:hypothetical protein